MEREQHETDVIELGKASVATRGQEIPVESEADGYRLFGLLQD